MRRVRMVVALVAALVAAGSVSGCTPFGRFGAADDDKAVRPAVATAVAPEPPERAWTHRTKAFSAVQNVGEVAVLMRSAKRRLYVDGLDPATGRRLWTDEASPSLLNRGAPLAVADIGGKVAYLRAGGTRRPLRARLVIVEPRTGKTLSRSASGWFRGSVAHCEGDPAVACVRYSATQRTWRDYRFSTERPKLRADRQQWPTKGRMANAYPVAGGGLMISTLRSGRIGRIRQGKLVWWHRLDTLFGKDTSQASGWSMYYHPEENVYTGTVGRRSEAGAKTWDLSKRGMVGFDGASGRRLWRDRGVSENCLGPTKIRDLDRTDAAVGVQYLPLRCRYSGVLTHRPEGGYTGKRLKVRIERFDIRTGKTVWSTPIGAAPVQTLRKRTGPETVANPTIVDDGHLAVDTGRRTVVLDLTSGKAVPATTTTPVWCQLDGFMTYTSPIYYTDTGGSSNRLWGSYLTRPCDPVARPARFTVQAVPRRVSAQFAAGYTVYATPSAVIAYRSSQLKHNP